MDEGSPSFNDIETEEAVPLTKSTGHSGMDGMWAAFSLDGILSVPKVRLGVSGEGGGDDGRLND